MTHTRPVHPWSLGSIPRLVAAAWAPLVVMPPLPATAAEAQASRLQIEYFEPKNPAYKPTMDLLKERRTLEKLKEVFSPFRLPIDLTLRTGDCSGVANAWYDSGAMTICYEYVQEILQGLPGETTADGITRTDAAIGQFFYVVAHEMGHAAFELFKIPVFGRAEDAADQFSTYIMLQFGKEQARKLISGAAYSYKNNIQNSKVTAPLAAFSDVHGAPAQRFYNLVCLAYGADPVLFADVVDKGYLPKDRASSCKREYDQVTFAFHDLIGPHIDQQLAKQVLDKTWLPEVKPKSAKN
jgi:Putative metallopeptidase